jgi:DNA-binding PadR family transcriptional regulator
VGSAFYKAQILEERLSVAVLLTLAQEEEPIIKGVLASKIARSAGTIIDRIDELQDAGLLTEIREDVRPFRKFVELTPLGREVAEKLVEIEDMLER